MTEHVDVVIVGAGISGISAAWHVKNRCPSKSFAILERRDNLGGTWDLFKYPGIRSDSDMFTLGFRFKPWTSPKAIADGSRILNYLKEAAQENGIDEHIRYRHRVLAADWSTADSQWTVRVEADGEQKDITCSFLFGATGYYNYDQGYAPEFPGAENFTGPVVHPQHWPEDLDYAGKRIVIIGSGATAVTLIPALANSGAGHVTMLQRSPTYIIALPAVDPVSAWNIKQFSPERAYTMNRWYRITGSTLQYRLSRRFPNFMRKQLMSMAERKLPEGFDVQKHFGPRYNPWDERLCFAPSGDLFRTISAGKADVVTDTIDHFTETGIKLTSGEELQADIIVTATGLNLQLFGGTSFTRDGQPIDVTQSMAYKGMMLSGVPNMAFAIGYTNASWTLKADLVSEFACRVLNYMDAKGFDAVEPVRPGAGVEETQFFDFTPGYVRRSLDQLPKSGSRAPWRLKQNYFLDVQQIRNGKVDDDALKFSKSQVPVTV